MSCFSAFFLNLVRRVRAAGGEYAVYGALLIGVAQIALFVALPGEGRLRVAVEGQQASASRLLAGVPSVTVTHPRSAPGRADIALGRLDAVVEVAPDGSAGVTLARSGAVAATVTGLLRGAGEAVQPAPADTAAGTAAIPAGVPATGPVHAAAAPATGPVRGPAPARGPASTLMGIWLMFLLTVGALCGRFAAQDRERRMLGRLSATPATPGFYLAANGIATFLLCFVPALLTVLVEGALRGDGVGLPAAAWVLVLGCTAALAAAFSLLVDTLLPDEDQAVMVAGMATLFTTLLSGSFIAPAAQGRILRAVSTVMPQRAIMELTGRLESGDAAIGAPLGIVAAVIAGFCLAAYLVTVSRLRRGKW